MKVERRGEGRGETVSAAKRPQNAILGGLET